MTTVQELIDWNLRRAANAEQSAKLAFFKDTAAVHLRLAELHRETANALAERTSK